MQVRCGKCGAELLGAAEPLLAMRDSGVVAARRYPDSAGAAAAAAGAIGGGAAVPSAGDSVPAEPVPVLAVAADAPGTGDGGAGGAGGRPPRGLAVQRHNRTAVSDLGSARSAAGDVLSRRPANYARQTAAAGVAVAALCWGCSA